MPWKALQLEGDVLITLVVDEPVNVNLGLFLSI